MSRAPSPFLLPLQALLRRHAQPPEKYGHQPRLYALTQVIGFELVYDEDVVCASAFLHDLGVFIGHRPEKPAALASWDHVAYTVRETPSLLASMGFPPTKVGAVLDAIRTHQPHDDPQTIEATILRDADILEQLGAVGVLRTVAKVGRDTRFPTFTPAVASLQRALDQLPSAIRLPTTRALAQPRIAILQSFLAAAAAEAGANLL